MSISFDNLIQQSDHWVAELKVAGWTEERRNVWKSPAGRRFLGPYGAWKQMKAEPVGAPPIVTLPMGLTGGGIC